MKKNSKNGEKNNFIAFLCKKEKTKGNMKKEQAIYRATAFSWNMLPEGCNVLKYSILPLHSAIFAQSI